MQARKVQESGLWRIYQHATIILKRNMKYVVTAMYPSKKILISNLHLLFQAAYKWAKENNFK